mgnify:CR=1 FL=1
MFYCDYYRTRKFSSFVRLFCYFRVCLVTHTHTNNSHHRPLSRDGDRGNITVGRSSKTGLPPPYHLRRAIAVRVKKNILKFASFFSFTFMRPSTLSFAWYSCIIGLIFHLNYSLNLRSKMAYGIAYRQPSLHNWRFSAPLYILQIRKPTKKQPRSNI